MAFIDEMRKYLLSGGKSADAGKGGKSFFDTMKSFFKEPDRAAKDFEASVEDATDALKRFTSATKRAMGKGGADTEKVAADAGDRDGKAYGEHFSRQLMKGAFWTTISYGLGRVVQDFDPLHAAFRGVINDEIQYMRNMRAIGYETQGITSATQSLQDQWQETGKTVALTGQSVSAMQQEVVKNMRKGVTTQKDVVAVTRTGLHVATMIGDQSNQIASTFADWHRMLQVDAIQMSQMGRDVQTIARETGVTGEHLAAAVKQSERLLKNMRDSATFTAQGARNMMELTTRFEKMGIGEIGGPMAEMMSGTTSFFDATNKAQQGFLAAMTAQSGATTKLVMGTFGQAKEDFRDLADAMNQFVRAQTGFSFDKIEQMPDQLKAAMNVMFKNLGMGGIGAAQKFWEQVQEQGMSMGEKIAKINDQLRAQNLTMDERTNLLKRIDDMRLSEGFRMMTMFSDAAKQAGNIELAFQKLASGDGPKSIADLHDAAQMAATALRKAGGKDFTAAIGQAVGARDIVRIRTVMEDMSKEQQRIGIDEKKNLDPISKMGQWFNELNEGIRDLTRAVVTGFAGVIAGGAVIGALGSRLMAGATMIEGMFPRGGGGGVGGAVGRLFGRGGTTAPTPPLTVAAPGPAPVPPKGFGAMWGRFMNPGGTPAPAPPSVTSTLVTASNAADASGSALAGANPMPGGIWKQAMGNVQGMAGNAVQALVVGGMLVGVAALLTKWTDMVSSWSGMTPTEMLKAAAITTGIITAAGVMMGATAGITMLAGAFGAAAAAGGWAAIPAIAGGLALMTVLTPLMTLLAAKIVDWSSSIMNNMVDPEKATKAASTAASVLKSAAIILGSVVGIVGMTAGVGFAAILAAATPLGWVLLASLAAGVVLLKTMKGPMVGLANAVVGFGEALAAGAGPGAMAAAERVAPVVENLVKIMQGIGSVLKNAVSPIDEFVNGRWWQIGSAPITRFRDGKQNMIDMLAEVADMAGQLRNKLAGYNVNETQMRTVAKTVGAISYILASTADIMKSTQTSIDIVTALQRRSYASDKARMTLLTNDLTTYFTNILRFVRLGVFKPLTEEFSFRREDINEVSFRAMAVAAILTSTVKMFRTLNEAFGPAAGAGADASKAVSVIGDLMKNKKDFAKMFAQVSEFLSGDILDKLKTLPETPVLQDQLQRVQRAAEVMGSMNSLIKSIISMTAPTDVGWIRSNLSGPSMLATAAEQIKSADIRGAVSSMVNAVVAANSIIEARRTEIERARGNIQLLAGVMGALSSAVQSYNSAAGKPTPGGSTSVVTPGTAPGLAEGGTITSSGMAVVHAGETVVPAEASPLNGGAMELRGGGTGEEAGINFRATQAVADHSIHLSSIADNTSALPEMAESMGDMRDLLKWQKHYFMRQDSKIKETLPPLANTSTRLAMHHSEVPRAMWRLGTEVTASEPPGGGYVG